VRFTQIRCANIFLLLLIPFGASNLYSTGQSSNHPSVGGNLEILTDTKGVDFNPYLRSVFISIKQKWFSVMPPAVQLGEAGRNSVTFRVMADGSVPKEFVTLETRSGKTDLDTASLKAVQKAAPFKHLPDQFSGSFVVLRSTFLYNVHRDSE
jgi:TonB family protein